MATEEGTTTTIDDLTDDLKVEIIRRMPRSSILQCLNVSKLWRSQIRDGPLSLTNTVNVAASYNKQGLRCMCLDKGMQQVLELDVLNDKSPYNNWSISSCNGLLFSYFSSTWKDVSSHESYMSNPWTKECVRLPNPTMTSQKFTVCGLAFENNSREDNNNVAAYKIVMAHRINPYTMDGRHNFTYKFEMYSSVEKRWQLLKCVSEPHPCPSGPCGDHYDLLGQSGVYCNRVLYWHCPKEDHALMFNLETETSGYMELPSVGDNIANPCGRILTQCDGLLHYGRIGFRNHRYRLSLWRMSMETSGWLMLHNVSLDLNFFPLCRSDYIWHKLKPIGISCQGDDNVLLAEYSGEIHKFFRIISYDFKRDVLEVVLQKDFLAGDLKFCRYTPTNKSIIKRIKTKKSKQKPLSNFGWNLLGCFKSAS